jgi:hypothetical protein
MAGGLRKAHQNIGDWQPSFFESISQLRDPVVG